MDKTGPFRPITRGAERAAILLAVFMMLLTAGSLVFSAREVDRLRAVTATVASERRVQVYACQLGNKSAAQQVALWSHVIAVSTPPPHETAAERAVRRATIAAFMAYVKRIFAPRDCAHIYRPRR